MGHDENRAPRIFTLPRKQNAIRYQRRFDAEDIEKFL